MVKNAALAERPRHLSSYLRSVTVYSRDVSCFDVFSES